MIHEENRILHRLLCLCLIEIEAFSFWVGTYHGIIVNTCIFVLGINFVLFKDKDIVFLAVEDLFHVVFLPLDATTLKKDRQFPVNDHPVEATHQNAL